MIIAKLAQLPPTPELAVIINVDTKYLSTLALLSTLRFAQIPAVVIDCESHDGSIEWFRQLHFSYRFHLMPAKLRHHGQTLDAIFNEVRADRVLLVDSDAEVLNDAMLSEARRLLGESPKRYGAGYLHPAHWLEKHRFEGGAIAPGIGFCMERPWIPFALLRVAPVRQALAEGSTFMDRVVLNDVAASRFLSRLLWARFRIGYFRRHRLAWLDPLRREYNGLKPSWISYDTGAALHQFLTQKHGLTYDGVSADAVPLSVRHISGVTRSVLKARAAGDEFRLQVAHPIIAQRLEEAYNISIPST